MKKLVFIAALFTVAACSNQEKKKETADGGWDVTVSGKVTVPISNGQLFVNELSMSESTKGDTVIVADDGSYSVTLHLTEPGYYRFNFFDKQSADLVLDRSNIELNVSGNDQSGSVEIKGSPDYDLVREIQMKVQEFQLGPEAKQIEQEFQVASAARDEAKILELQKRYQGMMLANQDAIVEQLKTKPISLGMINFLQGNTIDKDRHFPFYKEVAAKAIAAMPTSEHIKQFNEMVELLAITAIGVKAPEISLPDRTGKIVTLSSFKGKYVLVDFWAKWCGPCRRENPNVVKAYQKFHPQGLEILGVSLDRSKEDWEQAIAQDGLTWTHVSDLKYFESQAAQDYNINAIPFSILVDPDGVIIAKNLQLRGAFLHDTLAEVFGKDKKKS